MTPNPSPMMHLDPRFARQRIAPALAIVIIMAASAIAPPAATAQDDAGAARTLRLQISEVERQLNRAEQQVREASQRARAEQRRADEQARARAREAARQLRERSRQPGARGPEVVERFSQVVRLQRDGSFDISNLAGAVVITGGSGSDVRIDAVKRVQARNENEARSRLQDVEIAVNERGNRVEVRTGFAARRNVRAEVDYDVRLPQDASVLVKTMAGDIKITNVRGDLSAETTSGNVEVTRARRLHSVKSQFGDVLVSDAESNATFTGSTMSGALEIRGLKARAVDATTVSGNLRLSGVEAARMNLRALTGDIEYDGRLDRNGTYHMSSHSGDIRLAVETPGFSVDADTFSGDVRSDYALTLNPGATSERPGSRRRIRGAFGNGGAVLSLRSFSGDIAINRR